MDDIKQIVGRVIGDMSSGQLNTHEKLSQIWPRVVEAKDLEHTRLVDYKKGDLLVNVDSPARAYQLNLKKTKIMAALKKEVTDLKNIYFKVGKLK